MRLSSLLASLARKTGAFRRDARANVAMMFGLALVPVLVATGAGIDFARGVIVHQRIAAALDAAALAVGNFPTKPSACSSDVTAGSASNTACANLQALAQQYFSQNYDSSQNATYGKPSDVTISIANQTVTLGSTVPLTLTLLGIASLKIGAVTVGANSTVAWGQTKLWVALVLDNSGSMSAGDSSGSKMAALQDAITNSTYGLLTILQAAAANPGDVQVGIVPFTRSVNMGNATYTTSPNDGYIDWGEWEAPPANIGSTFFSSNTGPGSSCPFSTRNQGFSCLASSTNSTSTTGTIPSSGLICPGIDNGNFNPNHNDRYYNGCWNSVATKTLSTTTDVSTPTTQKQNCSQVGSGTVTCTNSGSANKGSASTSTSSTTTSGYTGDSTATTNPTPTTSNSDSTPSCSGRTTKTCTWTRTVTTTATVETVVKTGAAPYNHTWAANAHSTWSGCVMDRQQKNISTIVTGSNGYATTRAASSYDYDETNTQPKNSTTAWDDSQFPAENGVSCPAATVTTLNHDWSNLSDQVSDMTPNGSTNQAIGVEHGWQMLTTGAPYGTGVLPSGTTKVLILFSDGLNTEDRWYGDGSTEGTTQDGYIDTRENATCTAAKKDGVIIYAIFIHIGTNGSSTALSNCASDSTKFYDLTASSQIKTAFSDIAQKITNLRVAQ